MTISVVRARVSAGGAGLLLALGTVAMVPAGASASTGGGVAVPVASRLVAQPVTAATTPGRAARVTAPLRVRDPAQYAREKAAADRAYATWAAQHGVAVTPSTPARSSSIVALNKPGLDWTTAGDVTPPDTTGAIGPKSYVEFVNSEVAVYSRTTLASPPIASSPEDTFVGSTSTCDGQMKWDQAAKRFEYYSLDCAASTGSEGFSFGWSKTSSPTPLTSSGWCRYHVNSGSTIEDYGKLGNSTGLMIIGSNEFNDSVGNYLDSPILTLPKPANGSTTCPSETVTRFVPTAGNPFTPEPANDFSTSANGYIVALSTSTSLRMYTASGSTSPTLTDDGSITVPAYAMPANIPQPGTTDHLDASDTRLTQANAALDPSLHAIAVWTQHTIAGASGGPDVVRWYELLPGRTTPVQTGTITVSGAFAFDGAIAPTAAGNAAAIDYNVASSTMEVQLRAQVRAAGDPPGTMSNETVLASSSGVDNDFSCPSVSGGSRPCRWGDYAGASTDPAGCGNGVWGTGQLNGAPDGFNDAQWQTENFSLVVDECPIASFSLTTASPTHGTPTGFTAAASSDPDGSITRYAWVFGDGGKLTTTTATASHTYASAGTYTVTLTVTDSAGLHSMTKQTVTVS